MPKIKPIKINDFRGGLNLNESTGIEDNQLSIATNMFYDSEERLTVRRGSTDFGATVPDSTVIVNACNVTTDFAVADDATTLAQGTAIRGTNSVSFAIDVSNSGNDYATLTWSGAATVDISSAKGYLAFWLYVPAAFNTNLTAVKARIGSDSSNYYEWTLGTLTEASNNFIKLNYSDATTTGTPNDAAVDYFRLQVTYAAAYTDKAGVLVDNIASYAGTYTDKVHTLEFWKDSSGTRRLLAACGTCLYLYNEDVTNWEVLKTGLTDGLKFSTVVYGDVIYFTNGTDNYFEFDGTAVTERTGGNTRKGKYVIAANDIGYIAGVSTAPSVLYYSGAAPSEMYSFGNSLDIQEDDGQVITGLANLGPIVLVFKESSIYDVNIATPSREQLDYSGGAQSHRSIARVENDVFFLDKNGVFSLAQREGTTGSLRAKSLTESLEPLIDTVLTKSITAAYYWDKTNQYYLAVDTSNSSTNDTILVYNSVTKSWTRYAGITANDFTVYEDSSGIEHLLVASEYGGKVVELETGFNDNDVEIAVDLGTKNFDFGEPSLNKEYREYDIVGFISEGGEIDVTVEIDGEDAVTATILGSTYKESSSSITFGASPLGVNPLTGAPVVGDGLTLYLFKARVPVYQTGIRTRVKLSSSKVNTSWSLTDIQIVPEGEPFDLFPTSEIL